jgi:hypothetical protein
MSDSQSFNLWRFLKKVRIELVVFIFLLVASTLLMPKEALIGLASLLTAKLLTLTVAVIFAHLMRIYGFQYLKFEKAVEDHHWPVVIFLTVWYAVIIYAVAVGG